MMKEKMKFEEFKVAVVEGIKDWLPDSFRTADVSLQVITKNNNMKLTGLTITSVDSNIAPTIYLESFYESYEEGVDMREIFSKIAELRMQNEVSGLFDVSKIIDFEKSKNKIFPRFVSAERNRELLEQRPHIIIEDLAVIFYIDLGKSEHGTMSVPIHNDIMKMWKIDEDELYSLAVKNLTDINAGMFISLRGVIKEMMLPSLIEECDGDIEAAEEIFEEQIPQEEKMFVLTNKEKSNGACMILDKNIMQRVIEEIGTSFYILPSSIHECIIVLEDEKMKVCDLRDMVFEVNSTQVSQEDFLSNSVYRYTLEDGIMLA